MNDWRAQVLDESAVEPSTYNPRRADEERLRMVEMSLRKLGWLLPIYASGREIVSGHQRHLVWTTRIGGTRVPVAQLPELDLEERKGLNIAFNRGTCDMEATTATTALRTEVLRAEVVEMAKGLPDVDLSRDEQVFPCVWPSHRPIKPLLERNSGRWKHHAFVMTRTLNAAGARMPIVVDPSGLVVNGIGRLELAAEKGESHVDVIELDEKRAAFADKMLNLLSMDFDIHTRYRDTLRYNSFRRAQGDRSCFGIVWAWWTIGRRPARELDLTDPKMRTDWLRRHGSPVLDFGAGHFNEVSLLNKVGIAADGFEPYRLVPETQEIDPELSRQSARAFLEAVRSRKEWSSIFLATVLNSVPFAEDRQHILRLIAALCTSRTRVFIGCSSHKHPNWESVGRVYLNEINRKVSKFTLDYEPGITIGDLARLPKVQKYHAPEELRALCSRFFSDVGEIADARNLLLVECKRARKVDPEKLDESIRFEFDLPYPDGSTMGLVDVAREAFATRLGR